MRIFTLVLVLLCHALPALACHPRADPMFGVTGPADLKHFERIFVGEVVAVRLTEHIALLRQSEQEHGSSEVLEIMGGSRPFDFEVYPSEVLQGHAAGPQALKAAGCLVAEPALYDRVVVFQPKDGWARFRVVQKAKSGDVAADAASYLGHVRACLAATCSADQAP